jgi:chemotaxis protein histidine kinase CheA
MGPWKGRGGGGDEVVRDKIHHPFIHYICNAQIHGIENEL